MTAVNSLLSSSKKAFLPCGCAHANYVGGATWKSCHTDVPFLYILTTPCDMEVKLGDDENHGITFDFTVNVFIRHPKSKMIRVCI